MIFKNFFAKKIPDFYIRHEYAFAVCFALVWQFYLLFQAEETLSETDNFTHAMRVIDFIQSGSWEEIMYMHDNHPFGQILHFTRITDMFLYLSALPFLPFTDVKEAVFYGCFLYQPLIASLSAAGLIWAGKAFFGPILRMASLTFYFCQFSLIIFFTAGRADHHVLLSLLQIMTLGNIMYGFKTQRLAYFKAAGIFAGLSLWATPEGFLTTMLLIAGMILCWLIRYQNMRQIKIFSLSFFLTSAACLIVNPPMQGVLFADNGRLSILLVFILGLMTLSFYLEDFWEKEKKYFSSCGYRILAVTALTLGSFGIIVMIFGCEKIFKSPISPELYQIWGRHIMELRPSYINTLSIVKYPGPALLGSVLGLIALPFATRQYRKLLITLLIPTLILAVMTLFSCRFGRTASAFAALAIAAALEVFYKKITFWQKDVFRPYRIVLACIYTVCCLVFLADKALGVQRGAQRWMTQPKDYLPYISKKEGGILTSSSRGPETAWGTGRAVIGSPYHSNEQGITDAYNILYGTDMEKVADLLKKHQVTTILLDNLFYYQHPSRHKRLKFAYDPRLFVVKLVVHGYETCFLKKVKNMPPRINARYVIYHVDFTACGKQ